MFRFALVFALAGVLCVRAAQRSLDLDAQDVQVSIVDGKQVAIAKGNAA